MGYNSVAEIIGISSFV